MVLRVPEEEHLELAQGHLLVILQLGGVQEGEHRQPLEEQALGVEEEVFVEERLEEQGEVTEHLVQLELAEKEVLL
jgi:hypothetical protein